MALRPEVSLPVALATGAVVYGIYATHLPNVSESKLTMPGNQHLASSRKTATWTAAAVVAGISLIAKDPTIFIVGGTMTVVLDVVNRHANAVSPQTGKMVAPSGAGAATSAYPGNGTDVSSDAGAQGQ
jgi:hypothetical protein